jgi:PIN domain nuclease of toxin-antitoxin system
MRLLLDTCTFLWLLNNEPKVSVLAIQAFKNPDHSTYLSVVSVWEICLKYRLGRLPLPKPPAAMIVEARAASGIAPLALDEATALRENRLPPIHTDPFDRILVCQAIEHGLTILTPDAAIHAYPVRTLW